MASFYAELQVAGTTYPVRSCAYEFTQSTNERGRVAAKVRHGLVRLTLDVPDGDELLSWAAVPFKPLAGRVIFRSAQGGAALETLSWEDRQCVGYQEEFLSGSVNEGAYVCHLTIATSKFTMAPGGPASYVSPAAGEHGSPQQALMNPFVVPLLAPPPVIPPLVVPLAEDLAAVAARLALEGVVVAAAPVALILALILGSTTPAYAPGLPHPILPPLGRDELRLLELEAKHKAGTLLPDEQAELVALLAKVKGLHVQNLADIDPTKKPKYAPNIGKWLGKKGKIDVLENGNWKYTDWDGNAIVYEGDEPNFDKYARQQVDIDNMQGDCTSDFDKADKKAPLGPRLVGNTWHHKQNMKTMQEVDREVHRRFSHYGGRYMLKQTKNDSLPAKTPRIKRGRP